MLQEIDIIVLVSCSGALFTLHVSQWGQGSWLPDARRVSLQSYRESIMYTSREDLHSLRLLRVNGANNQSQTIPPSYATAFRLGVVHLDTVLFP